MSHIGETASAYLPFSPHGDDLQRFNAQQVEIWPTDFQPKDC
jgi:hypothetical protein